MMPLNNNAVFVATLWRGHQFGFSPVMVGRFYPQRAEDYLATMLWRCVHGGATWSR